MERGFAVIGLGYVGLPVALALAKKFEPVIGFDISNRRIAALKDTRDTTGEVSEATLQETRLRFTDDADALNEASFFIVTVPTPINDESRPDLSPLETACSRRSVRRTGAVVVFETTVYPGLDSSSADPCHGVRAQAGGRFQTRLFARADLGDKQYRLETTRSRSSPRRGDLGAGHGVYGASSRRASIGRPPRSPRRRIIENTRDQYRIMNELAIIFDRLGIPTKGVLRRRHVDFLPFTPGSSAGTAWRRPYYLTARARRPVTTRRSPLRSSQDDGWAGASRRVSLSC
jgi:UDP-N-acetyl-D-galactosamine dehydrogenase